MSSHLPVDAGRVGGEKGVVFWSRSPMMLAFMSRPAHQVLLVRPGSRAWWGCVAITALFSVWVNAVAVHLLIEPHPGFHRHDHPAPVDGCVRGQLHSHERDCQPPHLAIDHGHLLLTRTFAPVLPTAIMAGAPGVEPPNPPVGQPSFLIKHPRRPGTDPPDPAQPRAPPTV